MKKRFSVLLFTLFMILIAPVKTYATVDLNAAFPIESNAIPGWPQAGDVVESVAVVMEAEIGTIVYSKGADAYRYPASITKLMTLLIAAENSSVDEQVTFTETMLRDIQSDSSNIGMQVGEVLTMDACLNALMIASANEVATQIAEHVGGTEQNFVDMMNQKAAELGCKNTHFVNASGLPNENHYTTARDMALIVRAGLKNPVFRKYVGATDYLIPPTNLNPNPRPLHTHHPLLAQETSFYYPGAIGGKTGNSASSGKTLVTIVEREGVTYIAVLMYGPDMGIIATDSANILNYAYDNFTKAEVPGGAVIVPNGLDTSTLNVDESESNGKIVKRYYLGDYRVGTGIEKMATPTPVPTATPIPTPTEMTMEPVDEVQDALFGGEETKSFGLSLKQGESSELTKILMMAIGGMAVLLMILIIVLIIKDRRRFR